MSENIQKKKLNRTTEIFICLITMHLWPLKIHFFIGTWGRAVNQGLTLLSCHPVREH